MDRRIERLVVAAFKPYQIVIFISFISSKVYKAHIDTFGIRGINLHTLLENFTTGILERN